MGTCQLSLLCSPYQDRLIYIKRRVLYIHNKLFMYDYGLRPIFCSLFFFLFICFLPFDIWVHICVPICRFLSSCLFSLFGYIVYIPKMSGKIIICSLNWFLMYFFLFLLSISTYFHLKQIHILFLLRFGYMLQLRSSHSLMVPGSSVGNNQSVLLTIYPNYFVMLVKFFFLS